MMDWTHMACMAAGVLLGSFLMNERCYRREREALELHREMFNQGRLFPPATPVPCSRQPETRRIVNGPTGSGEGRRRYE